MTEPQAAAAQRAVHSVEVAPLRAGDAVCEAEAALAGGAPAKAAPAKPAPAGSAPEGATPAEGKVVYEDEAPT